MYALLGASIQTNLNQSLKMIKFSSSLSWIVPLISICSLASHIAQPAETNLIRVALNKATSDQAGDLGQPVTSYYTNIYVGTPPKSFKFLIDINGRETWIPHYLKLGIIFPRLHYRSGYLKKSSSTGIKEEQEYTINYDQQVELIGKAYQDMFEFQNVLESLVPVKFKQRFLAISSANNDKFTKYNADGVLALSPFPISETGSDLALVAIQRSNLTRDLKFSLILDGNSTAINGDTTGGGELAFGRVESTNKYLGALKYHQARGQHKWELNLQSILLGGETIPCETTCSAVLATNHNDIYGPEKQVARIIRLLGLIQAETEFTNQLYEIDCLKVASSPNLTFIIDGAYYVLHPLSYIRKKVDGILFKSSTCYVAILPNNSTNRWELGTNFLSNYYTIFDVNKRQVAFGVRR